MNLIDKIKRGNILTPSEYKRLFLEESEYIDDDFIREYGDFLDWIIVFSDYKFSEEFLSENMHRAKTHMHKMNISVNQTLSESFMEKYADSLIWMFLSVHQKMSTDFIKKNVRYIDFAYLPYYQDISLSLLKDLMKIRMVNWESLSSNFPLKEEFILEYFEYLDKDLLKKNNGIELTDSVKVLLLLKK
jgi:hypothetical protein